MPESGRGSPCHSAVTWFMRKLRRSCHSGATAKGRSASRRPATVAHFAQLFGEVPAAPSAVHRRFSRGVHLMTGAIHGRRGTMRPILAALVLALGIVGEA